MIPENTRIYTTYTLEEDGLSHLHSRTCTSGQYHCSNRIRTREIGYVMLYNVILTKCANLIALTIIFFTTINSFTIKLKIICGGLFFIYFNYIKNISTSNISLRGFV